MQVRVDAITGHHVDRIARLEGRSRPDALRVLVAEAIRNRQGIPTPSAASLIEDASIRGTTIACHCKGWILSGVQKFAQIEDRSLSAAIRILLRDALRQRGLVPPSLAPAAAPI